MKLIQFKIHILYSSHTLQTHKERLLELAALGAWISKCNIVPEACQEQQTKEVTDWLSIIKIHWQYSKVTISTTTRRLKYYF